MRLRIVAFASIVVAAMGTASLTTPAQAQAAGGKDRHCVTDVSTPNTPTTCYDSFTTAIAKATGGRVTDAPANVRKAMRDPKLAAQLNDTSFSPAADFVLSIEFDGSGYSGSSVTYRGTSACTTTLDDIDYRVALLPLWGDDQISSYRGFSNCFVKHWEHSDFTGMSIGFVGGQVHMGEMDNETSSIQWS